MVHQTKVELAADEVLVQLQRRLVHLNGQLITLSVVHFIGLSMLF
jgi:hypothetical protein